MTLALVAAVQLGTMLLDKLKRLTVENPRIVLTAALVLLLFAVDPVAAGEAGTQGTYTGP